MSANVTLPSVKDHHRSVMTHLVDVSYECAKRLIMFAPCKHSDIDPMPTWLLKKCAVILSPYLSLIYIHNSRILTSVYQCQLQNIL